MSSEAARLLASMRRTDWERTCEFRQCGITFKGKKRQKFCCIEHRRAEEYLRLKERNVPPPARGEGHG